MPFSYFERLSPARKASYLRSDAVHAFRLPPPDAEALRPVVAALAAALAREDALAIQALAKAVCFGIARSLGVESPALELLDVRPRFTGAELHGLYSSDGAPVIRIWMRTARHERVVAFKTFLHTLLHELVHHLDFTYLQLADSMHTRGFFMRETSLFHQLVPRSPRRKRH